jgi:acyl-lipid omega-6 desaturase (Delta-12 desaturase)
MSISPHKAKGSLNFISVLSFSILTLGSALLLMNLEVTILTWLLVQFLLAISMMQCFSVLHEAGHGVFVKNKKANTIIGYFSSIICGIPFSSWKIVHQQHHLWTGWKDLDPTTSQVTPRELSKKQKIILNSCWKYYIPFFSLMYRVNNFYNLPRLLKLYPSTQKRISIICSIVFVVLLHFTLMYFDIEKYCLYILPAIYIHLFLSEIIMLSQHTHLPQKLSKGEKVKPHSADSQASFSRTLLFPEFISRYVLFYFNEHEKHHQYPNIPGYKLNEIESSEKNSIHWWRWFKQAHKMSAVDFLFKNRNETKIII